MTETVLVRYGAVGEVARFPTGAADFAARGARVVVRSPRGIEVGIVLDRVPSGGGATGSESGDGSDTESEETLAILRRTTAEDERSVIELRAACERDFDEWRRRIGEWNLDLQLIDLEWTLDRSKLILYVLNDRGPDCTKLALQAAAAGLGIIEVQPVDGDGLVQVQQAAGGCGSGGGCCG